MTGLQKHLSREEQIKRGWIDDKGNINPAFKTIEQGASTTVWAAVASELEAVGGKYLEDCDFSQPTTPDLVFKHFTGYLDYALNKDNALRLWDLSMEWMKNPPK